ncbi:MAG: heme ABC transporter ATP-binding protein [Microcella sp.]
MNTQLPGTPATGSIPAHPSDSRVVLEARGVGVIRDGRSILHDIDLEVRTGEVLALVGPNGAGKATLLGALSGELSYDAGTVLLDGKRLGDYRTLELARRRAVLNQANEVSFPFLVREIVAMGRNPWVRTPQFDDDEQAIAEAVRTADVGHLVERRFTALSGGERARVSLARVLAQRTDIVFLDEPTAALDLRHQEDVMRASLALARAGRAVVVVLHDLSLAAAYADRIGMLTGGTLSAVGTPREVLTADRVGRAYGLGVRVYHPTPGSRPVILPLRD